jgi:hypothetical protein
MPDKGKANTTEPASPTESEYRQLDLDGFEQYHEGDGRF